MNPPALLPFHGDWTLYEEELHKIFLEEIARGGLLFRDRPVSCRRIPETAGRWAAFWHLVQEGRSENERYPDIRRCERLRWIKWVIENATEDSRIDEWQNMRGSARNTLLWYSEEYLVVLAERSDYWLLKSAYHTQRRQRIKQLQRERDVYARLSVGQIHNS